MLTCHFWSRSSRHPLPCHSLATNHPLRCHPYPLAIMVASPKASGPVPPAPTRPSHERRLQCLSTSQLNLQTRGNEPTPRVPGRKQPWLRTIPRRTQQQANRIVRCRPLLISLCSAFFQFAKSEKLLPCSLWDRMLHRTREMSPSVP